MVSLSEWEGKPEIHVRDMTAQKTLTYKTGDRLGEGVIATVDYRPMPRPDKPGLQSFSRLILKVDSVYWAIEQGATLADKRRLTPQEIPPDLVQNEPADP